MKQTELNAVLEAHRKWAMGEGGERADLRGADLWGADLRGADLRRANLQGADLWGADLRRVDLRDADLQGADLRGADLRRVDLRDADLRRVDLRDADLQGANLQGANLRGVTGNMAEVKSLQLETWPIIYTAEVLQIGCEWHPIKDWWEFDDDTISAMGTQALDWWRKWKDVLKQIIEMSPAIPTGHEQE